MNRVILALLMSSSIAHAFLSNLDSYIFDSTGNSLNSTSGSLNGFLTNATATAVPTKLTDGTNTTAVKAASTAAAAADPSVVIALSPNSPVPAGTNLIGKVGIDQTTPGTTNLVANTPVDGYKQTYTACSGSFALATLATDVFYLQGSGTKTIRVIHAEINGSTTSGSGALAQVSLIKRSAANTGGTSSAITILPHDSNNAATTAAAVFYTANPTALGAATGTLRSVRDNFTSAGSPGTILNCDFGVTPGQALVLRGTTQFLVVNFNATTVTGGNMDICVDFTEE